MIDAEQVRRIIAGEAIDAQTVSSNAQPADAADAKGDERPAIVPSLNKPVPQS